MNHKKGFKPVKVYKKINNARTKLLKLTEDEIKNNKLIKRFSKVHPIAICSKIKLSYEENINNSKSYFQPLTIKSEQNSMYNTSYNNYNCYQIGNLQIEVLLQVTISRLSRRLNFHRKNLYPNVVNSDELKMNPSRFENHPRQAINTTPEEFQKIENNNGNEEAAKVKLSLEDKSKLGSNYSKMSTSDSDEKVKKYDKDNTVKDNHKSENNAGHKSEKGSKGSKELKGSKENKTNSPDSFTNSDNASQLFLTQEEKANKVVEKNLTKLMLIVYKIKGNVNQNFRDSKDLKKIVRSNDLVSVYYNTDNKMFTKKHNQEKQKEYLYDFSKHTSESEINKKQIKSRSDSDLNENQTKYNRNKQLINLNDNSLLINTITKHLYGNKDCHDYQLYQDHQNYRECLHQNKYSIHENTFASPSSNYNVDG